MFGKRISKNKAIEACCRGDLKSPSFEFSISFRTSCSHGGFFLLICFWKAMAEFNIYDVRHWDYDLKCYEDYEDNEESSDSEDYLL